MQDRSRYMVYGPLGALALAAALAAPTLCVASRPTEPSALPRQALSSAEPPSTAPNVDGRRHVAGQDAGADDVAELLRRSMKTYKALGAQVAVANPHPDERATLQALRAVCVQLALQAALDAYLAEGADPVAHMRAHARPRGPDTDRTCERAVVSAAVVLESQIAFSNHADAGSPHRADDADGGGKGTRHNGGDI